MDCGLDEQPAQPSLEQLEQLASSFEQFASTQFHGVSPLYEHLSLRIAKDRDMLVLAASGLNNPKVLLFLGAIHFLLLRGAQHPLRHFYTSLTETPQPSEAAFPHFREFCLQHSQEITGLLAVRLVQTNEVQRCATLLPAFVMASRRMRGQPLVLIDIGASAGLNLLWDRYSYEYTGSSGSIRAGDPDSLVRLTCELRGEKRPPIPQTLPDVVERLGVDLNPVDARDSQEALWLRALIWPEQRERAELLKSAIQVVREHPPTMVRGSALDVLPDMVAKVPADVALCIFHSYTVNQLSPVDRERLTHLVHELSVDRDLLRISLEWIGTEHPQLEITQFTASSQTHELLAHCHPHGKWIEWLGEG